MGYLVFKSARLAGMFILTVLCLLFAARISVRGAEGVTRAAEGPEVSSLKTCWLKQVESADRSQPCFAVQESLRERFTKLVESWRLILKSQGTGLELRSVEYLRANKVDLLLAAEINGKAVAGPVSLSFELRGDEIPLVVSINESPSSTPPILLVGGVLNLLYILGGIGLLRRMKRDPSFMRHEEGKWSNRQAFLTFYPIALLPVLFVLLATLAIMAADSSFLLWIAYTNGAGVSGIQAAFFVAYLVLYSVALVCYGMPYVESLRRGPRSVREAAPARFTRKQLAVDFTKLGLIQAASGFLMWGIAVLLASKLGVPVLLSAAISAMIGVVGGQRLFVYWVKRKAVRNLSEDDPAACEAVAAFEEAQASIARKTIAVLPKTDWPAPNAFVIGLGSKRCVVAVTEPLLETLSDDEVAAVLLHEYGHVKEFHTAILALFISIMATWQLEFLLRGNEWLTLLGLSSPISIFLVRQVVLYGGLFAGLLIPFTLISRWCERRADRFAEKLGRGASLASALRKMSLATETPLEWPRWVRILSTHPSFHERILTLGSDPVLDASRK